MLLSTGGEPTMQNLDPYTAGIVNHLQVMASEFKSGNSRSPFCAAIKSFAEDILKRPQDVFNSLPMFELCVQAAAFLNFQFKSMGHTKILGDSDAYKYDKIDCLFILYKVAKRYQRETKSDDRQAASTDLKESMTKADDQVR